MAIRATLAGAASGAAAYAAISLMLPVSSSYTVLKVTDGDTVRVAPLTDGQRLLWSETGPQAVRLLCIAAPERNAPGGASATAFMAAHLEGHAIGLERDPSPNARLRDSFGRILATALGEDGSDPGLELVRAGLARVERGHPCPASRLDALTAAEREARDAHRGVWQ